MPTMKPKLAIYGGAFDPPTLGHIAAVERLLRAEFERVLVMPCFGHAFGKKLAPAADRLVLTADCFRHLPQVRVSSFEIDLGMNGSTYELVTKLPALPEYTSHQVFLAIGSDEANLIERWRRNAELREMIPFAVIPRPGHPLDDRGTWAKKLPHIVIPESASAFPSSSTNARAALSAGDFNRARDWLTPRVLAHIQERRLYQTPADICVSDR